MTEQEIRAKALEITVAITNANKEDITFNERENICLRPEFFDVFSVIYAFIRDGEFDLPLPPTGNRQIYRAAQYYQFDPSNPPKKSPKK